MLSVILTETRSMDMYDEPNANPVDLGGSGVPSLAQSWRRCCERLRAELGEDIFNSWFGRIELEAVSGGQARLSVPTRFLKSWIDTHYLGHITAALGAEVGSLARVVISVRSSTRPEPQEGPARCALATSPKAPREAANGTIRAGVAPRARPAGIATSQRRLGRLAPRSPSYVLDLSGRAVQPTGVLSCATRRRATRRRSDDVVLPALRPFGRRARQDPPAAGGCAYRGEPRPLRHLSDR